tara:strand:+ start:8584 stop:10797 length:2214 start_codon:yes stop_codon:yes gene_type:complete
VLRIFFILLVFCSRQSNAQLSCRKRPNGEGVRLDVSRDKEMAPKDKSGSSIDGSLKGAKVTSQGFIGSCAGHSTSLLIKAAHPDKPQVIPELIQACDQSKYGTIDGNNPMVLIGCLAKNPSRKYCPLKADIPLDEQVKIKSIQASRSKFMSLSLPDQTKVEEALKKVYFQLNTGMSSETATLFCAKNFISYLPEGTTDSESLGRDPSILLRLRHYKNLFKNVSDHYSNINAKGSKTRFIKYDTVPSNEVEQNQQIQELAKMQAEISNRLEHCKAFSCAPGNIRNIEKSFYSFKKSIDEFKEFQNDNKVHRGGFFGPSEEKVKAFKQKVSTIRKSLAGLENSIVAEGKGVHKVSLDVALVKAKMDKTENPESRKNLLRYKSTLVQLAAVPVPKRRSEKIRFRRRLKAAFKTTAQKFGLIEEAVEEDYKIVRSKIKKGCSIDSLEEMIDVFPIICKSGEKDEFFEKVRSVLSPLFAYHRPHRSFDPSIILDVFKTKNVDAYTSRITCEDSEKFKVPIKSKDFEYLDLGDFSKVPKFEKALKNALVRKILREKNPKIIKYIKKIFGSNKKLVKCLGKDTSKACAAAFDKIDVHVLNSYTSEFYPKIVTKIHNKYAKALNKNKKKVLREKLMSLNENKPAVLGICSSVLHKDHRRPPATAVSTGNAKVDEKNCGAHALTVIGYRCNKGKVEYLLQNSWGVRACNQYRRSREIECRNDKDQGKIWISEGLLSKGVLNLTQHK